ncbi:MAG TPA: 6-carboxytetrahydropterin synthase [Thermoanaerobaculia bacterium]|jgi:6-pyruvoyltetrahydropterin/6-carboxytetrahydropterin synthase|nr:6-carboxytetrahydropterin synthase [Thermoanaerobaculia bacterium]
MERPRYRIALEKEDFKFSAAHFTLFPDRDAERLHGHNYRVRVELAGSRLDELGLLADLDAAKRKIRALCAALDSRMLLPETGGQLGVERRETEVEVRWRERRYLFPAADVVFLPMANVSIELLADYLWQALATEFRAVEANRIEELEVAVEETAGQRCARWGRLD